MRHNSKNVKILLDGIDINEGLVKDTFINITYDNPLIVRHLDTKGNKGETSNTNDLSATITITCLQGSFANSYLTAKHLENITSDKGSFQLEIQYLNQGISFIALNADVEKFADYSLGNEEQNREWTIITTRLEPKPLAGKFLTQDLIDTLGRSTAEKIFSFLKSELDDLIS